MERRIIKFNDPPTISSQQTEASNSMATITFEVQSIPKKPMPQTQMLINVPED